MAQKTKQVFEGERETQRQLMARLRAAARDITVGEVVKPSRKKSCESDVVKFVKEYFGKPPNPEAFPSTQGLAHLKLSKIHLEGLKTAQEIMLHGGQDAKAWPRGFGKDTLFAIILPLWGALYGHSEFTLIACYEITEAENRIEGIKRQLEINQHLKDDFPEFVDPIRALERAAQRAKMQTYQGEFTRIEYAGDYIVLPSINKAKGSGCIIAAGSLKGSVRGMLINGRRPTFVVISDPQTAEVSKSPGQIEETIRKIRSDFGGLGSHSKALASVALVTIMRKGDVADQLTDPVMMPAWNGDRRSMIVEWPERMDLWEKYFDMRDNGVRTQDATGRAAHRFYLKNRKEMERGSVLVWKEAFINDPAPDGSKLESSALEHAMNLYWTHGKEAFETEYQNNPRTDEDDGLLTAELVASRLSLFPPNVVPEGFDYRIVQGIDIRGTEIHYVVDALKQDGTSATIDYYRMQVNAPEGDLRDPGSASRPALERAVLETLRERREVLLARPYRDMTGQPVEVALTLVDSGWLKDIVYLFCRESGPRWRATKGDQQVPGNNKFHMPVKGMQGVVIGEHWYSKVQVGGMWLYHLDADHWKLEAQERYMQTPDTAGSAVWFGNDAGEHKKISRHIVAEKWNLEKNKFEVGSKFNHFLDCKAMCRAAAVMVGASLMNSERKPKLAMPLSSWFKGRSKQGALTAR